MIYGLVLLTANYIVVGASAIKYDHLIYIDSKEGNNKEDCLLSNGSSACLDLNWVLQQPLTKRNSTHLKLSQGTHLLHGSVNNTFKDLTFLAISGMDSAIACSQPESGLVFTGVKNIAIRNVTFFGCATIQERSIHYSASNTAITFQVGVFFSMCENLTMSSVAVKHSPNATGVVLFNVTGKNIFEYCEFSHNIVRKIQTEDNSLIVGGGGVFIDTSHCSLEENGCPGKPGFVGTEYVITSCLFEFNEAGLIGNLRSLYPYTLERNGFGCGGGISMFIRYNTSGISLVVNGSTFSNNSAASAGGGVYVQFHDAGHENSVLIKNSHFIQNTCPHSSTDETSGGAIRFQESVSQRWKDTLNFVKWNRNKWTIDKCLLEENWALKGSGVAIVVPLQIISMEDVSLYVMSNSVFKSNVGKLGSAIYLEQIWKNTRREGKLAEVYVTDCHFEKNTDRYSSMLPDQDSKPLEIGIGTIYVYSSVLYFTGHNTFIGNFGSALALSDSNAIFDNSSSYFLDNYGHSGAAIALFGASTFSVGFGTAMTFENNSALVHGGAIFSQYLTRQNLLSDASCFIRHTGEVRGDDWNVTMTFINNTVHSGSSPNAIFTTSIWPCATASSITSDQGSAGNVFCWKGWSYYNSSMSTDQSECDKFIDTDVGSVNFSDGNGESVSHVKAFPGWNFQMPVIIQSDYGRNMSNSTIFNLRNNYSHGATYSWGVTTSVPVPENKSVLIQAVTVEERSWYFKFYVDLQPCPPGFIINNSSLTCQCASYGGAVDCNDKAKEAKINSGTWMGRYRDKYYVAVCPIGYCNESSTKIDLPTSSFELNEKVCSKNRKGYLCGECVDGYGPPINALTADCVPCRNESVAVNVVKYIFSVYVPLGILFSCIIIFDIRLTTGVGNAFILYSQVVSSTFGINGIGGIFLGHFGQHKFDQLQKAYRFPYGIFNLRFIEQIVPSICLSSKLNTPDILLLDYGVAFFPVVMIAIVFMVLTIKECGCDGRCDKSRCKNKVKGIHNALLPAFAAFLVFSYSRVSITSAYLISETFFIDENGNDMKPSRLFLAGQFAKNDIQYYYYFVPGLFIFIIFVALVPIFLLDFPVRVIEWLIYKSTRLSKFYPSIKVHILADTLQGCYRKNMRFFAGLYFLFRLAINISFVNCDTWLELYIIQQILTTIFVLLISFFKPYKRKCLNYVDILIFSNLAIINSISLYFYVFYKTSLGVSIEVILVALVVQYILIFLPLIVMCLYIIWQWKFARFMILKCLLRIGKCFHLPVSKYQELYTVGASDSNSANRKPVPYARVSSSDGMDALWERAEDTNRYRRPRRLAVIEEESYEDDAMSRSYTSSARLTQETHSTDVFPSYDSYGATESTTGTTIN